MQHENIDEKTKNSYRMSTNTVFNAYKCTKLKFSVRLVHHLNSQQISTMKGALKSSN